MSSRTQIDFRGSSIQARSLTAGAVVSESSDVRTASQTLAIGAAAITVQLGSGGHYVVDAVTSDSAWAAPFSVVKAGATYTNSPAGAATVSAGASGTWTPTITTGGLFTYTRSVTGAADTVTVTLRKL